MGKRIDANRDEIRTLYVSGITTAELARRYNLNPRSIETWARRDKWRESRSKLRGEIVEASKNTVETTLAQQSKKLQTTLAGTLQRTAESLERLSSPRTIIGIQSHADALTKIAGAAAKVHGWSDQAPRTASITLVSQLIDREQERERQAIVDVEPIPEPNPTQ